MQTKRQGYTLVEMLTVIAIVLVVAGFSLVGVAQARARARDDQRIRDLKLIQTSLELYRTDIDRSSNPADSSLYAYPTKITPYTTTTDGIYAANSRFSKYLTKTPVDPLNKSNYIYYAPACLHPAYGSTPVVISPASTTNFKTVAQIKAETAGNRSCPTGSGWLPYAVMGVLERSVNVGKTRTSTLANLANDTNAVAYSIIKPIFVNDSEATSAPAYVAGSYCYPASASCTVASPSPVMTPPTTPTPVTTPTTSGLPAPPASSPSPSPMTSLPATSSPSPSPSMMMPPGFP